MSGKLEEIYYLKAAALLHDPPHKAWIVLNKMKAIFAQDEQDKRGWQKIHEAEAVELANRLLDGTPLSKALKKIFSKSVKDADRLASAQDRILLGDRETGATWGSVCIKNIFDPEFVFCPKKPSPENIKAFAENLNQLLKTASDPKTAYHLLYSFLELLWFSHVKSIGPADTRIPHHSIFDHLYATASMVNWTQKEGGLSGKIVYLDLAGIQEFVAPARKLRDYWAGSWLVSAVVWYMVSEVVEELGPDVLIIPTARLNPFYYYWVFSKIDFKKIWNKELREELEKFRKMLLPDGWPMQPVVPGTAILVLPDVMPFDDSDSWEEYFERRYRGAWKKITEASLESFKEDAVREKIEQAISDIANLIENLPPLVLRVRVKDLREVMESGEAVDRSLIYYKAVKEVTGKSHDDAVRISMGSGLDWNEITRVEGSSASKIYRICNMCYRLPAVIRNVGDKIEYWENGAGYREILEGNDLLYVSDLIKEREALCPYCLVKRGASSVKALKDILTYIYGLEKISIGNLAFPSTSDVSSLHFKKMLLERLKGLREEEARKIFEEIEKALNELKSEDKEKIIFEWKARDEEAGRGMRYVTTLKPLDDALRGAIDRGEVAVGNNYKWRLIHILAIREAEPFLLGSASRKVRNVLRENGIVDKRSLPPVLYYGIVKADGDDVGNTLMGKLKNMDSISHYYDKMYREWKEGEFKAPPGESLDEKISWLVNDIKKKISAVERSPEEAKEVIIPISPSYHATISRALIASALSDIKVVRESGGFVVYAGGDDLVALVPVYLDNNCPILSIVQDTRIRYWGFEMKPRGFIKVGGSVPAILSGGRSYGVKLAHYRDPMRWEIEAAGGMEQRAKHIEHGSSELKDGFVLGYGRGNIMETQIDFMLNRCDVLRSSRSEGVPIEKVLSCHYEGLEKLWSHIFNRKLSISLLYDVEEERESINMARKQNPSLGERLLWNIIKRNIAVRSSERDEFIQNLSALYEGLLKYNDVFLGDTWLPLRMFRILSLLVRGVRG